MQRKQLLAYIQVSIAMVLVGSFVVVSKVITGTLPIFFSSGVRFAIAAAILLPMMLRSEHGLPKIGKKDTWLLFILAFSGNFLYSLLLLYGLRLTSAVESGIILGTTPVLIGIISFLFLRESLKIFSILAILLATAGIIITNVLGASSQQGSNPLLGNLMILGAALGEALWMLLGKNLTGKASALTVSSVTSLFGLLLFSPFAIYEGSQIQITAIPTLGWLTILYYGVATVLAYLFWQSGLANISANTAGVLAGIQPLSAVFLAALFLQEPVPWTCWIGVACIFLAIVLMSREPTHAPVPAIQPPEAV